MKQHITKEQLNELSDKQLLKLTSSIYGIDFKKITQRGKAGFHIDEHSPFYTVDVSYMCVIGEMINTIRDNGFSITCTCGKRGSLVQIMKGFFDDSEQFEKDELVDALWEAVKYVLGGD